MLTHSDLASLSSRDRIHLCEWHEHNKRKVRVLATRQNRLVSLPELVIDGASVVIVGQFNPATITPGSLAGEGLLGKDEALSATSPILTPRISVFDAAWLHCEATDNRLLFSTVEPLEFVRLCDVAAGVLSTFSPMLVSALGLNRSVHFPVASRAEWDAIGDTLVPKSDWENLLTLPGTKTVALMGVRPDDFVGHIQITIEPSFRMEPGVLGIYVDHNDHYALKKTEAQPSTREEFGSLLQTASVAPSAALVPMAKEVIMSHWQDSMARAERAIENVWQMRGR